MTCEHDGANTRKNPAGFYPCISKREANVVLRDLESHSSTFGSLPESPRFSVLSNTEEQVFSRPHSCSIPSPRLKRLQFRYHDDIRIATCCGTWNRTKILSFKGSCPTVRRSRTIFSAVSLARGRSTAEGRSRSVDTIPV